MTRLYVDGPMLIRAVEAATRNLERHVDEVDALNVFPVPDGDTGSNMLATMRAALAEAQALPEVQRDLDTVAEALSRGALTGARGNSGVILSQIIRGMTHGADGRRRATGLELAEGLRKGSEVAYESVLTPVEGTILTVIRDAADAAEAAAGRQPHVEAVLAEVIEAAASSVQRTPMLLPVLEDAGVVDSGGQGLYRVLEGMLQVEGGLGRTATHAGLADRSRAAGPAAVTTARVTTAAAEVVTAAAAAQAAAASAQAAAASPSPQIGGHEDTSLREGIVRREHIAPDEHGYETQFLLSSPEGGIDVDALRIAILEVGSSVVVAGDVRLVRVHVHGERPDLAIAAGLRWGRLSQVEVTDLDEQVTHHTGAPLAPVMETGPRGAASSGVTPAAAPPLALVAVTRAPGLARVLASFGARIVVPGHGTRPSVGEIAQGILASGSGAVIVLPNDRDAVLAAGQAASLAPLVTVEVIPTRNAAEGIAAAVAFDPTAALVDNLQRMSAEAAALRSFTVVTAAKDSVVDGTRIWRGQVIALDAGRRMLAVGRDVETVTLQALAQYEDIDLVTIYWGESEGEERSRALCERIEHAGLSAEVEAVYGGQAHDHLLVAVE